VFLVNGSMIQLTPCIESLPHNEMVKWRVALLYQRWCKRTWIKNLRSNSKCIDWLTL